MPLVPRHEPPQGYSKLPAGMRCKCINLWEHDGDYWCCKTAPTFTLPAPTETPTPKPWLWEPQGEANNYRIRGDDRWLALVQLNGEMLVHRQEQIMSMFVAAPRLVAHAQHQATIIDSLIERLSEAQLLDDMDRALFNGWSQEHRKLMGEVGDG